MPGYNVEWKARNPATHQNTVTAKSIEKAVAKDFPLIRRNTEAVPEIKPALGIVYNDRKSKGIVAHSKAAAIMYNLAESNSFRPFISSDGKPQSTEEAMHGVRLASISFWFGTGGFCVMVLGFILLFAGAFGSLGVLSIYIGVVLASAAIIIECIAFYTGTHALKLINNDPALHTQTTMANIGALFGAVFGVLLGLIVLGGIIGALFGTH